MLEDGLKYQDSRMADSEEIMKDLMGFNIGDSTPKAHGGPVLYRNGETAYLDSGDTHTLIVGDTGSMKTLRFVLPLIYTCVMAQESMLIVDPKGELSRKTHEFLKSKEYKTVVLNFRHPQKSPDSWNPMKAVETLYSKGGVERQTAILQLNDLLNEIFYKRNDPKDTYWNESAGQFAFGICMLLLELGESLNMKNLLRWRYEKLNDGTLKDIYDKLPTESEVYQNLAGYMDLTAENTKSCIRSTFDQLVRVFKSAPALTEMLSSTTFDMSDIGNDKVAVFIVIPDEKTTFHFLATLFISQCYTSLLDDAEENGGILQNKVNFILEEFCNLPAINDIVPMITAARSRNIRMHMVIQSYGQLVEKYGENSTRAILDNCGNLIYLHSRELQFLKYISDLAGVNEYGHQLLSTSRLQRLAKNETLIFHNRCYPILSENVPLIFEYPINIGDSLPAKHENESENKFFYGSKFHRRRIQPKITDWF